MNLFRWIAKLLGASPPRSSRFVVRDRDGSAASSNGTAASEPPQSRRLEGLDADQFAPISARDAASVASSIGANRWGNPWFGRRDLIPPTGDPRTQLIDRLMVSEGLATSEELADIHEVGAEMDRIRPDLAHAGQLADEAVARGKEERKRIKLEKKAAAAERRRLRAEEIVQRKRTDIDFLGRGVSSGLADRRSDVALLEEFGLPTLATPAELAEALAISIPKLRWLAWHTEAAERTHYIQFTGPKKSGGVRTLAAPHCSLRLCQQWMLENIVSKIPVHDAAHGFVPERSTVTNATPHVGQQVIVNADLRNFFPTITFPRILGMLQTFGYSPAVATILALLATECQRQEVRYAGQTLWVATGERSLPQGACTSPAFSNAIAWRLDRRLAGLADTLGWTYTRYADDMTFSTSSDAGRRVGYLLARLRHIASDEGFQLHPNKTRVLRPSARQTVTGIVVNDRAGVPRKTIRQLRAILHNAKRTGLDAQNRYDHPHFESWLAGMIAYVRMVNPEQAAGLSDAWERLRV
ncbi:MAG: reverse transcriptase family protein [Aeoliella sp.]